MAKTDEKTEAGMDKAGLKRLLRLAREEPISVAFALDGAGKAILQMDRRKPGRALEKQLKQDDPESKSHRWGTAAIDPDDPKRVRFLVNKASSGIVRKLVVALKGTGISKVELLLEDGTPVETHEEPDEEDEAEGEGGAAAKAAEPDARPAPVAPAKADEGANPGQNPDQNQRAAALTRELTGLVKRMMPAIASDPALRATLTPLATNASALLKRGDLDGAEDAAGDLARALDATPKDAAGKPGAPINLAAFTKARAAWVATRAKIVNEVGKLRAEMEAVYKGHGVAPHLDQFFRKKIEPMLAKLDHRLSDRLDEVVANTDAGEHAKRVQQARKVLGEYQDYLAGEPFIAELDGNPFVPLTIGKTLTASLATLDKVIA